MTTITHNSDTSRSNSAQLESFNPNTGRLVGRAPVVDAAGVAAAVATAHGSAHSWGARSHEERGELLLAWRREMARRLDDFVELIHEENGKSRLDALLEVWGTLYHLSHCATHAAAALREHSVPTGVLTNMRATVSYRPFGVVGVIGPWNMPLFTPMGSIVCALAAGNTVVFKPSELTPLVGELIAETASAAIDVPGVVTVVTGDGQTGAALASSDVDKLAFTGSARTGRKVLAAAAERLTPVVLELGGKDALIVAGDADLGSAAKHATYGAFSLAGQACISVERCYVAAAVYEEFVDRVVHEAAGVRVGGESDAHIGAITRPEQLAIIRDHIEEATAQGARVLCGGVDAIEGNFVPPTVLVDVNEDMRIMREETFGPVLPIVKVENAEEGVRRANSSAYALGSSIFGHAGVEALASKLRAAMTSINTVFAYALVPSLPFGGRGESGFGRVHGEHGLREFSVVRSTVEERFALPVNLLTFQDDATGIYDRLYGLTKQMYGGGAIDKLGTLWRKLNK
jgi:acyl-CoA reductase-like NAD-dependent aldehyde dehydrogenase